MLDLQSLVKYLLEGLAVAAAAFYIPRVKSDLREIAMIALTAAAVFALLDQFAPRVAVGARQGAGFGIGFKLVGGGDNASPAGEPASETASNTETSSESFTDSEESD